MRAWYQKNKQWKETDSLLEALGIDTCRSGVLAVVGAGGKTSTIFRLAEEFATKGLKVAVTTTTHMVRESGALAKTAEESCKILKQQSVIIAGRPANEGKITSLDGEDFKILCNLVDIVLVEADGSKGLPLKVPASHEPVIPQQATMVIVLCGLSGLGKTLFSSCHRAKQVQGLLQVSDDHIIKVDDIVKMVKKGYIEQYLIPKELFGIVIINQADDNEKMEKAFTITQGLAPFPCIITQLKGDI